MSRWYFTKDGHQKFGPFSYEQIQQLAASGQLRSRDMVWNEGASLWTAAGSVPGVRFSLPLPGPAATRRLPLFPRTVAVAGILWIIIGSLWLLGLLSLFVAIVLPGTFSAGPADVAATTIILGLIGAAFLHVGLKTVKGKARDTVGNSLGSIGLGLFNVWSMFFHSGSPTLDRLAGAIFLCAFLWTAGILGLVGRSDYKSWRLARHAAQRS